MTPELNIQKGTTVPVVYRSSL